MKKTSKKSIVPDSAEFTDDEGKKWVRTSTEDLFSIKELNEILESIENEGTNEEIILARIDFQKVNKEYYEKASELQKKLSQQSELMKKFISEAKEKMDRKNKKLYELIEYIKKLHLLIDRLAAGGTELKDLKIDTSSGSMTEGQDAASAREAAEQKYEAIEEVTLPPVN